jgi:phosphatidyl-myo-inositol dimannoside synthase
MSERALLLTPSRGQGGGIERYVETVEWAFLEQGVEYHRLDLSRSGPSGHVKMLSMATARLRTSRIPIRLVLAHRCLLPVAMLLAREHSVQGISVICHGRDIWGSQMRPRWRMERRLMRASDVRVVGVSSFTSGMLFASGSPVTVLSPGLSRKWFDALVAESAVGHARGPGIRLVTAFRLSDWRDKGLPELLRALEEVDRPDIQLTICGTGKPSLELFRLVENHDRCTLRSDLTDSELAREFAVADLFILATRTRVGRDPCGEGYGLVLLEAQIAGTPVIGPAYGGSHDAYVERFSGLTPMDESAGALAAVLQEILKDTARLVQMGAQAALWSRASFAPETYASRVVAALL